jgi:hypothetical protein
MAAQHSTWWKQVVASAGSLPTRSSPFLSLFQHLLHLAEPANSIIGRVSPPSPIGQSSSSAGFGEAPLDGAVRKSPYVWACVLSAHFQRNVRRTETRPERMAFSSRVTVAAHETRARSCSASYSLQNTRYAHPPRNHVGGQRRYGTVRDEDVVAKRRLTGAAERDSGWRESCVPFGATSTKTSRVILCGWWRALTGLCVRSRCARAEGRMK